MVGNARGPNVSQGEGKARNRRRRGSPKVSNKMSTGREEETLKRKMVNAHQANWERLGRTRTKVRSTHR